VSVEKKMKKQACLIIPRQEKGIINPIKPRTNDILNNSCILLYQKRKNTYNRKKKGSHEVSLA
jgi:hypothetical protein